MTIPRVFRGDGVRCDEIKRDEAKWSLLVILDRCGRATCSIYILKESLGLISASMRKIRRKTETRRSVKPPPEWHQQSIPSQQRQTAAADNSEGLIRRRLLNLLYRTASSPAAGPSSSPSTSLSVTVQAGGNSDSMLSSHSAVVALENYCFRHNGPQY